MERIQALHQLGQSLWYDNIQRRLLENGELGRLIERGDIRGVTSNPSIFHNAIARSSDYDAALKPMAWAGWSAEDIFYQLAIEDIRAAADLFRPLYEQSNAGDGYVSLEVSPYLANDGERTYIEAQNLWERVGRPNLMVKIPATSAGIDAIRRATAAGINVNVTLIFSIARYLEVMNAYLLGLEERVQQGLPIDRIASVASFFVSRVDTKIDAHLKRQVEAEGEQAAKAAQLPGKAAIANARLAYAEFLRVFGEERFTRMAACGARKQRPLWASTSTKNPAYRDVIYVEELIGPDTVNTVPPQTLDAFREHGNAAISLGREVTDASQVVADLDALGISMDTVTRELEVEGVKAFSDAFTALIQTIDERRRAAVEELNGLALAVQARVRQLDETQALARLFDADPTLWTVDERQHAEIRQRLGWLRLPETSRALLPELATLRKACAEASYTHTLLLGMGGSSLAPEVYREIAGLQSRDGIPPLDLAILDSTDPAQVKAAQDRSPLEKTLFIVASKSGTTGEVNAFLDYFWGLAVERFGDAAGEHFVAVTDPGTKMEKLARARNFRQVLISDPTVGGRYSALTPFGLIAAALIGMDVQRLLERSAWMAAQSAADIPAGRNPGLVLGAILGEASLQGVDKLTILTDSSVRAFGSWLEQLIAESSGKEGKGIVPVDIEPAQAAYSRDRLFVYFRATGEQDEQVTRLRQQGHPVVSLPLEDPYDLGPAFYQWEVATAIATAVLGVNGFDQPDVQDNKTRTLQKIEQYQAQGQLDEGAVLWQGAGGRVYGQVIPGLETAQTVSEVIERLIALAGEGDYIAINAYLPRNPQTLAALQALRASILARTGRATTLGFGPRFLHSTGQLHKGGPNNGVFLQLTRDNPLDLTIPEQGITFGVLERAQAVGDLEALLARGRRAIRLHLAGETIPSLE
jgi:transaldolase/glucose-6-phosphate isomerase